jgi:hypothetical protein
VAGTQRRARCWWLQRARLRLTIRCDSKQGITSSGPVYTAGVSTKTVQMTSAASLLHGAESVWPHGSGFSIMALQNCTQGAEHGRPHACPHGSGFAHGSWHSTLSGGVPHVAWSVCPHGSGFATGAGHAPQGSKHAFAQRWLQPRNARPHGRMHLMSECGYGWQRRPHGCPHWRV